MKKREIIRLGDLDVDPEARQVTRAGEEIQLGRLSFDLLEALIRNHPAALSCDDLVQTVWSGDFVSDGTLKQRVSLLRRGLGQAPDREYVETLRGFGYRLGTSLERVDVEKAVAPAADRGTGRLARICILILTIASLILLIVLLATAVRQVKRMSWDEGRPSSAPVREYLPRSAPWITSSVRAPQAAAGRPPIEPPHRS